MAMVMMATALPGILLSPFMGAIVDRSNRKRVLLFADSFAGVFSLMLAAVLIFGKLEIWHVYLVAMAGSIANTLMWPAMTATTSLLVPKEQFGRANGLLQFGDAGSIILAPILAGFIFGFFGLKGLVVCDVASFVIAITMTLLCKIPQPAETHEGREAKASFWAEAGYGFKFVFARPGLVLMMSYFMLINLVQTISNTLIAPIVLTHWKPQTLGLVQSVIGVGMLVGTIIMTAWGGPRRKIYGFAIFSSVCFLGSLVMLLPLSVFSICACFLPMMLVAPMVNACSQAIWQRKTPADVQGKVFAVRRMFAWFMTPLSFALAGPLADHVFEPNHRPAKWVLDASFGLLQDEPGAGLRSMFLVSGLLTLAVTVLIFMLPRFRNVETDLPDAELKIAEDPALTPGAVPTPA